MTNDASPAPQPRKRGRPAAETPREKLDRMLREIATLRVAVREEEQRRFVILGEAIAAEAEANPELKTRLREILTRRVTSPTAKAEIASLLVS